MQTCIAHGHITKWSIFVEPITFTSHGWFAYAWRGVARRTQVLRLFLQMRHKLCCYQLRFFFLVWLYSALDFNMSNMSDFTPNEIQQVFKTYLENPLLSIYNDSGKNSLIFRCLIYAFCTFHLLYMVQFVLLYLDCSVNVVQAEI